MSEKSLCIFEAVSGRQNGSISEEEYLQCIVNHCTGTRHGANKLCNGDASERTLSFNVSLLVDPFAKLVAEWGRHYRPSEDKADLYATLKAYRERNVSEFRAKIHDMAENYGRHYTDYLIKDALACHALWTRDARMLKALIEEYPKCHFSWWFDKEFDDIKRPFHGWRFKWTWSNFRVVYVLWRSNYRSIVPPNMRFADLHTMDYMN